MADNNLPQDDNFEENLTSLEPDQTLAPATQENLVETAKVQDQEKKNKREELFTGKKQTPEHVESLAIAEHKKQVEAEEKAALEQQKVASEVAAEKQVEIDKIQADIDYAAQHGIPSTALEAKLKALEADKSNLIGGEGMEPFPSELLTNQPIVETDATVETPKGNITQQQERVSPQPTVAEQPSMSKVAELANQVKVQNTIAQAQELAAVDEIEQQRAIVKKAQERLDDEDLQLSKIDNDRFWDNKATWQKIGMGIALIFGAAGSRGNQAADQLNKMIERDINAQKLDNESALAKRQEAFKRVKMEIDRMSDMTDNEQKKMQLALARQKVEAKENEALIERQQKAQASAIKNYVLKNKVKLEDMSAAQIAQIFTPDDFKVAKNLRTEYNSETRGLGTNKVISAYNRITESAKDPTGAGDLAMIFNYMKMLDPGSVVRESEFKNAAATGALTDRYAQKAYDQLVSGRFLHPNQRADFKNRSSMLLKGQLKTQGMVNERYNKLSRNSGIPSDLVIDEHIISEFSPREALWDKKKAKNSKLKRENFDKSVDRLIEQGKLSKKFE